MEIKMATKSKDASIQNPARPERIPERKQVQGEGAVPGAAADEAERELDNALQHTFPASDPISSESTLVSGGRR
jgi:hypothetical protein